MTAPAERRHRRAVFAGSDMPHSLALGAYEIALGSEMSIRVDLHLHSAVAEDALGDDGDHIHALDFRGNNEGRRLVVGIGRARSDGSHKGLGSAHDVAVPFLLALKERNHRSAPRQRAIEHHVRIDAHQLAITIAVAVASSQSAGLDVAEHRAGVATNGIVVRQGGSWCSVWRELRREYDRAWLGSAACARRYHRESRSGLPGQWG